LVGPGVVGVAKGHLTVRVAQDVLLRQHPAIEVAPKESQRLVPPPERREGLPGEADQQR
jgi:hypothetical protein